ncbi:metallophosphoesterase [Paraflavisolibacter sp. H34]|uniref:metallophosphoesterase n=1 Tax=Huijunlia imazamoxiresistens TaxID=3127457 RepID=UPI0030175ADF
MKRRHFIKTLGGLAGMGLAGGLYAWQIEPFWLEFVRLPLPVKNLPEHLAGKTLMQISDIHVSKLINRSFLLRSFQRAAALQPDFVAYTGDYISIVDGHVPYRELDAVLQHAVKGRLGTFGILGNHDYGINWKQQQVADNISDLLHRRGVILLQNDQKEVSGLNFIGLDDLWGINFAPWRVMQRYDPSKANILLCHNPDVCDLDVWNRYEGWILAGHTHGGQCKPPFLEPPVLPVRNKRYTAGKFDLAANRTLYINRALGHTVQVRFNVRPEITLFELQRA